MISAVVAIKKYLEREDRLTEGASALVELRGDRRVSMNELKEFKDAMSAEEFRQLAEQAAEELGETLQPPKN